MIFDIPTIETERIILCPLTLDDAKDFVAEHALENYASGRVIEKCGLVFDRYSEYTKFDGSKTFKAKVYKMTLK